MRQLVFVALVGCSGDSVDLTGMYRVDSAVGSAPCGTDTPLQDPPAFLKFSKDEFLGQTYFKYDGCTDEAGTDCMATGGLFSGFFESIDGGWRGVVTSSAGAGGSCTLGYFEQTAILDGDALVIESHDHRDVVELPDDKCEPEAAEKRGDEMPCVEHRRFDATRLSTN